MPKGVARLWRAFLVGQSTLETLHKMQIDPECLKPAVAEYLVTLHHTSKDNIRNLVNSFIPTLELLKDGMLL